VAALATLLGRHGVEARVEVHGLDTALRARTGAGGPRVAVLAEQDALPGIGHACGQDVIAATAIGAFVALHRVWAEQSVPGEVVLLGTPAEEGRGRVLMMAARAFDGLDTVLMLPFALSLRVAWVLILTSFNLLELPFGPGQDARIWPPRNHLRRRLGR